MLVNTIHISAQQTRLAMAATVGVDGVGAELVIPAGNYLQVRAGYSQMPAFKVNVNFDALDGQVAGANFDKMADLLNQMFGLKVDPQVQMQGQPTLWNAKLLIDVLPFRNKHWYFTAGVYAGSTRIMHAMNAAEDMSSMMAINLFNNIYNKVSVEGEEQPLFSYNGVGINLPPSVCSRVREIGMMSMPIGTLRETGKTYELQPDENGLVTVDMKVNAVRPYIGAGYRVPFTKDEQAWFAVNVGAMYWGRAKLITHDGVDILNDLDNMSSSMMRYVTTMRRLQVVPMLQLSIVARLF